MGKRENKVESYLDDEITKVKGVTRKWVCPGRDGVPDRIIILHGAVWFVEVKTLDPDSKLSTEQIREHRRLRKCGADVTTVFGHRGVDAFVKMIVNDIP